MTDRGRGARGLSTTVRSVVCGLTILTACAPARAVEEPPHSAELDAMIVRQAKRHGVPESLVRRIVMRESKYNPRARNRSYWGLMQISYPTAKSMGFKGSPSELLNPLVNLTYAVPYLANAFIIAGKRENEAVRLYASGYYFTARTRGLLGALRTADSSPMSADQIAELQRAAAESAAADAAAPVPAPLQQIAQQDAAAPLPEHRPSVMPEGKSGKGDSVDMVIGRKGDAAPPKKWTHDGGVTRIARGDQPIEQIAAYGKAPDSVAITGEPAKLVHGHMQKTTLFAAIYRPTANAQAYAATADGQDPRLAQAPSQAAIAEMASGQPAAAPAQTAEADPVAKPKRHARTARKAHETTKVARVDASDDDASKHRGSRHAEDAQASQAAPQ